MSIRSLFFPTLILAVATHCLGAEATGTNGKGDVAVTPDELITKRDKAGDLVEAFEMAKWF